MKIKRFPAIVALVIALTFSMNPVMANQSASEQCETVGIAAVITSALAIGFDCFFFACGFTLASATATAAVAGVSTATAIVGGVATTGALGCLGGALENSMSD